MCALRVPFCFCELGEGSPDPFEELRIVYNTSITPLPSPRQSALHARSPGQHLTSGHAAASAPARDACLDLPLSAPARAGAAPPMPSHTRHMLTTPTSAAPLLQMPSPSC